MLTYLRTTAESYTTRAFAVLSFLVLLLALLVTWKLAIGYTEDGIVRTSQAANRALAEVLASEVWQEIHPFLRLDQDSSEAIRSNSDIARIDGLVRRFTRNTDIVKVKIFDLNGITRYSSDFRQIGEDKSQSAGFTSAMQSIPNSELSFRQSFESFGRTLQQVNLISSYVPVRQDGLLVAVLEIYSDRSNEFTQLHSQEGRLLAGLTVVYVSLYVVLLFFFMRTEAARRQHAQSLQDLAAQNDAAKRVAEQGSRMKSQFLATMSHEIRTPMNGVIGMANLLEGTPLTPVQQGYVRDIVQSGESLLAIINDILDISKIEAGKMEFDRATFDLPALVHGVHALLKVRAAQKGIGLTYGLDEGSQHCFVGDALRIRQVLLNLVSNAVKFTDHGDVHIDIVRESQGVRMAVRDTGIGMGPQEVAQLFQSFTQVDGSATRRFGGTGLGLAISKKLVEGMGGTIGVQSEKDVGTTFWCVLPLVEDTAQAPAPLAVADVGPAMSDAASVSDAKREDDAVKGVLLLVEDHPVNQKLATTLLQRMGYVVDVAADGSVGVDMALQRAYDAIFMDVQMPVMNGFDATRAIRQAPGPNRSTWVVALTANAMESDRQECLSAGMNDFLSKPLRKDDLAAALERLPRTR